MIEREGRVLRFWSLRRPRFPPRPPPAAGGTRTALYSARVRELGARRASRHRACSGAATAVVILSSEPRAAARDGDHLFDDAAAVADEEVVQVDGRVAVLRPQLDDRADLANERNERTNRAERQYE